MAVSVGSNAVTLPLPDPDKEVLPGLPWGLFDHAFTPAFWYCRAWYDRQQYEPHYALGVDLTQEIVACLLGGHGIPAEIGVAAFRRLERRSLLNFSANIEDVIFNALREPLYLGNRLVKYRFPSRRAYYISRALAKLNGEEAPSGNDLAFRAWLLEFEGVGPKTASWITRNVLGSDKVAILDIHILRAGILANLFPRDCNVERDYYDLEARFLDFGRALRVPVSHLDAVIWDNMRFLSSLALQTLRARF